jgi:phage gpG-like protein
MSHTRSAPASGLAPVGLTFVLCALVFIGAAQASSVLNVHDEGHLRFVHASGSVIIDEGRVSGTFPGSAKVRFLYNGEPDVSARFTITGHGGSISARGTGRLSSPTSPSPSFSGHMTITGGTGRYAHIHGSGELFGVYYRRSYGLTVQAIGKLPY